MHISHKIKTIRERKGISQEFLAELSGLSLRTIQRIENNETTPRGDSLKRIAIALETSPDEIIDWKIQEDHNYLTLMGISPLGFLFFPILGIIIPLVLWIIKKDKLNVVNQLGKDILNFQISWILILIFYYILLIIAVLNRFVNITNIYIVNAPIIVLYAYNIIVILKNTIYIYKNKPFKYHSYLKILK